MFLAYKDSADVIDNYENTLTQLIAEIPAVKKSVDKLGENINAYHHLLTNGLHDNPSYDSHF